MLLDKANSCLVLIDVQEKLTPLVLHSESLINHCQWLIKLAKACDVPCFVNEQYPQGLGKTISLLEATDTLEKTHFSCWQNPLFQQRVQASCKKQLILIGIETHVCVLQTAIDLWQAGYEVFVVVDAVSSRKELDHRYALKRMKTIGIELITHEMVFFEWVRQAGTPEFKLLSQQFLQSN